MANFKTHISVAAVGSGLVSTSLLGAGIVSPGEAVAFWAVGTTGGILPDIDADHSTAVKSIFTGLGLIVGLLLVFSLADNRSIIELWIVFGLAYTVVRYAILPIFYKFTVHRGIFHSIVAALFFWFLTTVLCFHFLDGEELLSWTVGFFVFFGYIVHLSLDELFSVDLTNNQIKRSFGTALELVDYSNLKTSALMTGAAALMLLLTPSIDAFATLYLDGETYHEIVINLLPKWI